MSKYSFEELVYRITGNVVSEDLQLNSEVGTTYNFFENMPHQPLSIHVAKNAKRIGYNKAVEKIFNLATTNKALSSVVVEDIVDIMDLLFQLPELTFNIDRIQNREIKVRLLERLNTPINSDIVYNVLFYKITGRTLYVRTFREFRRSILNEAPSLTNISLFIERNQKSLAQYYRRNRSLLLFVKNTFFNNDKDVRSLINKISKKSRYVNKPASNKTFNEAPLENKPTSELLKMLYASDKITVRNGLEYIVQNRSKEPYPRKEILNILRTRNDIFTDEQKLLMNDGWSLALPSSAKRAAGIVPNGSSIEILPEELFGVRWSDDKNADSHVDLDLSFTTLSQRYGWDADKNGQVSYSGDMTHMSYVGNSTQSASELFTINQSNLFGVLDISSYNFGENTTKIELIIGDIALPIEKPTSTTVLGYIFNNRFYINVDNKLNAKSTLSQVNSQTVTNHGTFNDLTLANIYTL